MAEVFGALGLLSALLTRSPRELFHPALPVLILYFVGISFGAANNFVLGMISPLSAKDYFSVMFACGIAATLAIEIKKNVRAFTYFLMTLDLAILMHLSVLCLPYLGVNFPYWMGDFQGETVFAPITHDGRFVGLGQNPHQIGLLLTIYFGFVFVKRGEGFLCDLFHFVTICAAIALFLLIKSTTLLILSAVAVVAGTLYIAYKARPVLRLAIGALAVVSVSLLFDQIASYFFDIFSSDGKRDAGGRFDLWRNGLEAIYRSNLLGLGPGAHSGDLAPFGGQEAHNVFIDIFMQGGVVSVFCYLFLLLKSFFRSARKQHLIWAVVIFAMMVSQMTGYFLRYAFSWIPLLVALVWTADDGKLVKLYFRKK